uniref:Thyrotropin-releasing hormone receptor n=1 Tax=Polyphagotarsonemus latus TaxID=1204166 RepID=A0AAN0LHF8_9ACAR
MNLSLIEKNLELNFSDKMYELLCVLNETDLKILNKETLIQFYEFCSSQPYYPFLYQVIGSLILSLIGIIGVLGNLMVIYVVFYIKSMQTPTNFYLASLAVADLLVLLSTIPFEITSSFIKSDAWLLGELACKLTIYVQYMSINGSAANIAAFTYERYTAICHPIKTQTFNKLQRAKKRILTIWIFVVNYNLSWFFITSVKKDPKKNTQHYLCIFYIIPLILSFYMYTKIIKVLFKSSNFTNKSNIQNKSSISRSDQTDEFKNNEINLVQNPLNKDVTTVKSSFDKDEKKNKLIFMVKKQKTGQSNRRISNLSSQNFKTKQVVKLLILILSLFAILWLPYRLLVVYNSLVKEQYLDIWFLLFCKSLVFINSAINPILYNFISKKFRYQYKICLGYIFKKKKKFKTNSTKSKPSFQSQF